MAEYRVNREEIGEILAGELPMLLRSMQLWLVQLQRTIESAGDLEDLPEERQKWLTMHEAERTRVLDLVASITSSISGRSKDELTRDDVKDVRRFIAEHWDAAG